MNKKQAGIIVTLLALIVCAGILAAKVNGPLEVTGNNFGDNGGVLTFNKDSKDSQSNTSSSDYFATTKIEKEQSDAQVLANLQTMVDNKSFTDAQKKEAIDKYTKLTTDQNNERRIEQVLKGKGFEDVICYIQDNKVSVIVKAKEISPQQVKVIKDVVTSVTKISNIEVGNKE